MEKGMEKLQQRVWRDEDREGLHEGLDTAWSSVCFHMGRQGGVWDSGWRWPHTEVMWLTRGLIWSGEREIFRWEGRNSEWGWPHTEGTWSMGGLSWCGEISSGCYINDSGIMNDLISGTEMSFHPERNNGCFFLLKAKWGRFCRAVTADYVPNR